MKNPKPKTYRKRLLKPVNGCHFHSNCFLAARNYCDECLLARLSNLVCINDWEAVSPDMYIPGGKWYQGAESYSDAPHQLLAQD